MAIKSSDKSPLRIVLDRLPALQEELHDIALTLDRCAKDCDVIVMARVKAIATALHDAHLAIGHARKDIDKDADAFVDVK